MSESTFAPVKLLRILAFGGLFGASLTWAVLPEGHDSSTASGKPRLSDVSQGSGVEPDAAVAPAPPATAPRPPALPPLPESEPSPARISLPESAIVEPLGPPPSVQLSMPLADVDPAQLHDEFNDARGAGRGHEAIDIPAPLGTPVLAVDAGVVAKLFTSVRGGLTVYQFDTPGELAYYYAHLDAYAEGLVEGQVLARGDLIGYVGFTGNANPAAPHLHFAVFRLGPEKLWWKGEAINPYPLLGGHPKQSKIP